ncbi:MAG: hypothetical protein EU532_11390 [Promethearchaeota archaeon]|nr:MAG: hypothetical protein EU532_11390 [Candidatus Lokiarchaeota archaeon]
MEVINIHLKFTKNAEIYLEKKVLKYKKRLNLVLHVKDLYKNCYTKIEPDITFETDKDYIESLDKVGEWRNQIEIFLDKAIKPFIKDLKDIIIDVKGRFFKKLIIVETQSKTKYGCRVVFNKDVLMGGI